MISRFLGEQRYEFIKIIDEAIREVVKEGNLN